MIIKKYGIELHRLTEDDIELVRMHRNSEFIRSKMFYQKEITAEEQKQWFTTINNDWNYYFLIHSNDRVVGMVHGTIESYEDKKAKGGLFLWDKKALNSQIPVIASILITDLNFFIMGMKMTSAEVRLDNLVAINYNVALGYTLVSKDEESGKAYMELTKENYLNRAKHIRGLVQKLSKDAPELSWDDISFPEVLPKELYTNLPDYLSEKVFASIKK